MCPGGFVIPAATGPEQLVVNGMSPSNRGTAWSNSGMVVETHPEDVAQFVKEHQSVIEQQEMKAQENASLFTPHSSLQMMYFQEIVEKQCWQQGNMKQTAPAQRMADFVNNRLSYDLPKEQLSTRLDFESVAFLDAVFREQATAGRLQDLRQECPWFPDQRGYADSDGDQNLIACPHRP